MDCWNSSVSNNSRFWKNPLSDDQTAEASPFKLSEQPNIARNRKKMEPFPSAVFVLGFHYNGPRAPYVFKIGLKMGPSLGMRSSHSLVSGQDGSLFFSVFKNTAGQTVILPFSFLTIKMMST